MEKGDIVVIYQNYITKDRAEGKAKLIKRVPDNRDSDLWENWKVKFLSDGFVVERMVTVQ